MGSLFKLHLNEEVGGGDVSVYVRALEIPWDPVQADSRGERDPSIQTNGEVLPSSNFSCPPLLTFPTPSPKGIPIRLGRCPSHLGLTGKEVGTSGEKDRIHRGKKQVESGGGE